LALPVLLIAGCELTEAPLQREKSPRPVTVIELQRTSPRSTSQFTGSVASWKTEQMGFQVQGRVESVLEPGRNIRGRTVDETDAVISQGTMIAALERDRYVLQLAAAEAQAETAAAKWEAKDSEIKNVIPQQVNAATAAVTLAGPEHARIKRLFDRGAATRSELDQAKANLDTVEAELKQVKASGKVAVAELASLKAQEREADESVNQAKKDLQDTELRSPFHGQIAKVHQIPGGFVQPGAAVVTVQMMDPIAVHVAVSAKTDARLNYNDIVSVYLPDAQEPIEAMVYEKATVADAATRTFRVTLLVRNERIEVGLPDGERKSNTPRVRMLLRLFTETRDRTPPYYVNVDALHRDDEGFFVFRVANATQTDRRGPTDVPLILKKVRVTPGEKRLPYLQVATMRELVDYGDLDPKIDLLAGAFFKHDGSQIPSEEAVGLVKDGDMVPYVRERWMMRPGDIVRVDLQSELLASGFYVPTDVILEEAGKMYVFAVDSSGDVARVKRIPVRALDAQGTLRRIEADDGKSLDAGMQIVSDGALFLIDGERVSVVSGGDRSQ
jgi:hypothetical protein